MTKTKQIITNQVIIKRIIIQKSSYVAPYYGQNAAPVARQIYPFNGNKTQALQQLPNFQTALNAANNEANKFGSNNKVYNDYSIEEHNGNYKYVFSFKDPNANGKYSIVTVDYTGQAMVTEAAHENERTKGFNACHVAASG